MDELLPARRRPQGLVIIGVCLSVRTVFIIIIIIIIIQHLYSAIMSYADTEAQFCPQDISRTRTGLWITTKFGGWEQGVNL